MEDLSTSTSKELPQPLAQQQPHRMSLIVGDAERVEMDEFSTQHPDLGKLLLTSDDLCHALKVIASIKENERFSTSGGIYVQPNDESWVWMKRWLCGDDRTTNIKTIKMIFIATFALIDKCLIEREEIMKKKTSSRPDVIQRMKNAQLISRLTKAIVDAKVSMEHLKKTYKDDAHTVSRIDMLSDSIKDRLQLICTSLQCLEAEDLLTTPLFKNMYHVVNDEEPLTLVAAVSSTNTPTLQQPPLPPPPTNSSISQQQPPPPPPPSPSAILRQRSAKKL